MKQIVRGKEEVTVDVSKYNSDGEKLEFIVTARPFRNPEGQLLGIVESFQDITKRKDLEIEKEKSDSHISRRSVRIRFAPSGLAHNFQVIIWRLIPCCHSWSSS